MHRPERHQRRRTKGWRTPPGAVHVGRGTRWGNPIVVGSLVNIHRPQSSEPNVFPVNDPATAVEWFKRLVLQPARYRIYSAGDYTPPTVRDIQRALAGRDLVCWCPPESACHADLLIRIANR